MCRVRVRRAGPVIVAVMATPDRHETPLTAQSVDGCVVPSGPGVAIALSPAAAAQQQRGFWRLQPKPATAKTTTRTRPAPEPGSTRPSPRPITCIDGTELKTNAGSGKSSFRTLGGRTGAGEA